MRGREGLPDRVEAPPVTPNRLTKTATSSSRTCPGDTAAASISSGKNDTKALAANATDRSTNSTSSSRDHTLPHHGGLEPVAKRRRCSPGCGLLRPSAGGGFCDIIVIVPFVTPVARLLRPVSGRPGATRTRMPGPTPVAAGRAGTEVRASHRLQETLRIRFTVNQAIGVLMASHGITADQARTGFQQRLAENPDSTPEQAALHIIDTNTPNPANPNRTEPRHLLRGTSYRRIRSLTIEVSAGDESR